MREWLARQWDRLRGRDRLSSERLAQIRRAA